MKGFMKSQTKVEILIDYEIFLARNIMEDKILVNKYNDD